LIGTVLDGRYRVGAMIARGGMSTVYRGMDLRLDRPVAIKVMKPSFAADPSFLTRFEREATAGSSRCTTRAGTATSSSWSWNWSTAAPCVT
jgi:serine/threonine protein kinase